MDVDNVVSKTQITDLNEYCLIEICRNLDKHDLYNLKLTNKYFGKAIDHIVSISEFNFCLESNNSHGTILEDAEIIGGFLYLFGNKMKSLNIDFSSFEDRNAIEHIEQSIEKYCKAGNIKRCKFKSFELNKTFFEKNISFFNGLEYLKLNHSIGSRESFWLMNFIANSVELKELHIDCGYRRNCDIFRAIATSKLEVFHFKYDGWAEFNRRFDNFPMNYTLKELSIKLATRSYSDYVLEILSRFPNIKRFEFTGKIWSEAAFKENISFFNELEYLKLVGSFKKSNLNWLMEFIATSVKLKELHIDFDRFFHSDSCDIFRAIATSKLEIFDLNCGRRVNLATRIDNLKMNYTLKELRLKRCSHFNLTILTRFPNIKRCELDYRTNEMNLNIFYIIASLSKLESFCVSNWHEVNLITHIANMPINETLKKLNLGGPSYDPVILTRFPYIERVESFHYLYKYSLDPISALSALKSLELQLSAPVDSEFLASFTELATEIRLEEIKIEKSKNTHIILKSHIEEGRFAEILCMMQNLKKIYFEFGSNTLVKYLPQIGRCLKKLESITFDCLSLSSYLENVFEFFETSKNLTYFSSCGLFQLNMHEICEKLTNIRKTQQNTKILYIDRFVSFPLSDEQKRYIKFNRSKVLNLEEEADL